MTPIDAHQIASKLWMGAAPPPGVTLAASGFNILVLCAKEYQPPAEWFPGVDVARVHLNDDGKTPFSAADALAAYQVASQLAKCIKFGQRVLVTCWEGRNRSGLVTALTLTQLTGCSGADAARAVRFRRQPRKGPALVNQDFVDALMMIPAAEVKGVLTRNAAMAAGLAG
jgi:hypothetical protein